MTCFFRISLLLSLLLASAHFVNSQNIDIELSNNKVVVSGETYIIHVVKEKQTLYSISKAYGFELSDIMEINQKTDPAVKVGEALKIPITQKASVVAPLIIKKEDDQFIYHVVKKGETLFSLYQKYKVDIQDIKNANPELDNNLAIGSVINIPKQKVRLQKETKAQSVPKHDKKYFYYVIKKGDTEYSICNQFYFKLRKFRKLNPHVKNQALKIGSWVRIPRYLVPPEYFIVEKPTDTIAAEDLFVKDSTDKEQLEEEIIQDRIRIALFLPLYLEANDTINQTVTYRDSLKIVTERKPRILYSKSRDFIRFYQGVLLAVDSLKKEGLLIDLHVFDTNRDTTKTFDAISQIEYNDFDFIVGPVYQHTFSIVADFAQRKKIPIISPLSAKNPQVYTNPFVIRLNTSLKAICERISEYVCTDFELKNLVVVHPNFYEHLNEYKLVSDIERNLFETGKYWENDRLVYKKISFEEHGLRGIGRILCDTCENIIILPSNDQAFIENVITNLNVLSKRFNIRLIGFSRWQRYKSLDPDLFYNLNLSIFSPYCIDYREDKIENFVVAFRDRFLTEPNDFSFSGFDLFRYFAHAAGKYGKDFPEHMNEMDIDLLQSAYHFKRVNAFGGLENEGVHFINYGRDFKVRHHVASPHNVENEPDLINISSDY